MCGGRIRAGAAQPRARLSRGGLRWALEGLVIGHLTVARVAEGLGVSWNTTNAAVLAEGQRVLIDDPAASTGSKSSAWMNTSGGTHRADKYVTVIIDLTPVRDRTGPARLLDMIEGRSSRAFAEWPQARDPAWRKDVQVVAMDGFTGLKTAASGHLSDAVAVMDPFHVVKLAADALDECRRRI